MTSALSHSQQFAGTGILLDSKNIQDSRVIVLTKRHTMTDMISFTGGVLTGTSHFSSTRRHSTSGMMIGSIEFTDSSREDPSSQFETTNELTSESETSFVALIRAFQVNPEPARRPVSGLFFSIGLLIMTGMAFWIRAAWAETILTDPNRLSFWDADEST
jgi:hypothetical protein